MRCAKMAQQSPSANRGSRSCGGARHSEGERSAKQGRTEVISPASPLVVLTRSAALDHRREHEQELTQGLGERDTLSGVGLVYLWVCVRLAERRSGDLGTGWAGVVRIQRDFGPGGGDSLELSNAE